MMLDRLSIPPRGARTAIIGLVQLITELIRADVGSRYKEKVAGNNHWLKTEGKTGRI